MDYKIKNKNDNIIKSINKFFNDHNIKIDIRDSDIIIIDYLLNNKIILNKFIKNNEIKERNNNINLILKKKIIKFKKHITLNDNKYFLLFIYIIIYIIKNKQHNKSNFEEKEQYSIAFRKIFNILIALYKYDILSFHFIFLLFEFYFELIKNSEILSNENIDIIIIILNCVKKIVKISNIYKSKKFIKEEKEKKLINEYIYNVLEKIFIKNNNNIIFGLKLLKNPKILDLIKICYDYYINNIIDNKNKNFIKNNLVKLFLNRLNYRHLDYFYGLSKKYLLNLDIIFDNNNKNYISLFNGILEFFIEMNKIENSKLEKDIFYTDKYFIFNSSDEKSGMKTSPIVYNNKFDLGLTIIFSFNSIKNNNSNNNSQVILSLNNAENNNYIIKLLLIKNNLYYYTKYNEKKNLLIENIKKNCFNICFIYYDQSIIYFFINNEHKFFEEKNILKAINNVYIELGFSSDNISDKFNGIIGPVIIFNSIINNQFNVFLQIGNSLKGKYYLTAEKSKEKKADNNKEKNIYFSYEDYYGLFNIDIDILNKVKNSLGNALLYINPEVVLNNINFYEVNEFKDCQVYDSFFKELKDKKNSSNNNIYYSFNSSNINNDYAYKEESLLKFFINIHGFNYIILNLEAIFNYLIILNDDKLKKIDFSIM